MRRTTYQILVSLIVLLAFALGGCGDSDEVKSQRLLSQAETLLEQGDEDAAETILADLFARYPSSQAAVKGRLQLKFIQEAREKEANKTFSKIIDSYRQVLSGYRAMYSEYPRSIASLDESDYFFDSEYLDEITPENYHVFLFLQADGSGYRLWCFNKDFAKGYSVDAEGAPSFIEPLNALEELKSRFSAEAWESKLVALSLR